LSYKSRPLSNDVDLVQYLARELRAIEDEMSVNLVDNIEFKVWNNEPDKPRAGQVYYADGTNWAAGSGEGLYIYKSGGSWVFLG